MAYSFENITISSESETEILLGASSSIKIQNLSENDITIKSLNSSDKGGIIKPFFIGSVAYDTSVSVVNENSFTLFSDIFIIRD